jgi:hypothetical protein
MNRQIWLAFCAAIALFFVSIGSLNADNISNTQNNVSTAAVSNTDGLNLSEQNADSYWYGGLYPYLKYYPYYNSNYSFFPYYGSYFPYYYGVGYGGYGGMGFGGVSHGGKMGGPMEGQGAGGDGQGGDQAQGPGQGDKGGDAQGPGQGDKGGDDKAPDKK